MEKLIHKNGKIIGTAGPNYNGPGKWVYAPENFDYDNIGDYSVVNGELIPPNIFEVLEARLDDYVELKARERGYGTKTTAATVMLRTYNNDAEPRFAKEAQIFRDWSTAIWKTAPKLRDKVLSGEIPIPKTLEDALVHLPPLNWEDYDIPDLAPLPPPPSAPIPPAPQPPTPTPSPVEPPAPVEPPTETPSASPVTEPEPEPTPEPSEPETPEEPETPTEEDPAP